MRREDIDPEAILDRVSAGIREETPDPAVEESAAERVWLRLSSEISPAGAKLAAESAAATGIHDCSGYRRLFPDYREKALPKARVLLLEDHLRSCLRCRQAFRSLRPAVGAAGWMGTTAGAEGGMTVARPAARARRWALAAAALLAVALAGTAVTRRMLGPPTGLARVDSVEGALFRVSGEATRPLLPAQLLGEGEGLRTGKASTALVSMADGSRIEMRERSEISLVSGSGGATIRLARGSIIVQAARQPRGHLFVATEDCLVSVVGTIFSVNRGTKGSRVSVLEGEVHVEQGRRETVLRPGEQLSTSPRLESVALDQEVAWSRDAATYRELLRRADELRAQLDRQMPSPPPRHSTRLLDLSPPGTVFYVAIPNLGEALSQGHRFLRERIQSDDLLRQWWQEKGGRGIEPVLERVLGEAEAFGGRLGEEVVLTVQMDGGGRPGPLLMAEVKRPDDFVAFLRDRIAAEGSSPGHPPLRLLSDPLPRVLAEPSGSGILLWVHGDLFAATPSPSALRQLADGLESPATSSFPASTFRARIAESYREGAEYIVCADIERMIRQATARGEESGPGASRLEALRRMGLLDLQHLILETKDAQGREMNRAVLTFDRPRRGLASWLAPPAPMGALEFLSPDAELVADVVVKDPASLFEDLTSFGEAVDPGFWARLSRFQTERGVNLRDDFAAPVGGEFAFALDGPMLPVPSWKLIVEVYDPVRLQKSIEWLVDQANGPHGEPGHKLSLEREESEGRTYYALRSESPRLELHYVFVDGYLLAGPSRSLLERAIRQRDSRVTLPGSPGFAALLPSDGQANFSAVVYQNFGADLGSIEPLIKSWPGGVPALTPGAPGALGAVGIGASPSLLVAYGEEDRIVVAGGGNGRLDSDLAALLTFGGLLDPGRGQERAAQEGPSKDR